METISQEQRIKGKEIFKKMYDVKDTLHKYPMCFDTAKQCAIISIENIIEDYNTIELCSRIEYWQLIKNYLVNLTYKDLQDEI